MTDQQIPADKVRQIIARHRDGASHKGGLILDDLKALLPRPTLADMTDEERAECQWMQADVYDTKAGGEWVIRDSHVNTVNLVSRSGKCLTAAPKDVTPRPDLPRLEWPGTEKPEPERVPALPVGWRIADHRKYGRVIVTNTTPNRDGYVYYLHLSNRDATRFDWDICDPDELTYIDTDQEADTSNAVPPNTLTVGSVWNDADALARACEQSGRDQITVLEHGGYVYVWDGTAEWWEGSAPPNTAPFTIIHTGKETNQ